MQGIFDIKWPVSFKSLLSAFTVVNFDFVAIVPLECSLQYSFLDLLVVRTIGPLIVVAILLTISFFASRAKLQWADVVTNIALLLTFLCYPGVTQTVFRFFQTETFEGGFGTFLIADYSIDVNGGAYKVQRSVVWH